jgi:molybdate transport system substrate-binding protein
MTTRRFAVLSAAALLAAGGCSAGTGRPGSVPPPVAPAPGASGPGPGAAAHHHAGTSASAPVARSGAPNGRIVVSAATAMTSSLTALAPRFEEAFPGTTIVLRFGTSATHARRIVDGAVVDVLVSSDPAATARVSKAGYTRGRPALVARDPLVIAVPAATPTRVNGVADLTRPGVRVALCAAQVPCGSAARRILATAGMVVKPSSLAPDAPTALGTVRAGGADAALVHRTDVAAAGTDLRPLDFAQATAVADEYAVVAVSTGRNTVGGAAFVAFLESSLARRVFSEAGFSAA